MDPSRNNQNNKSNPGSTTSLGKKRRSLGKRKNKQRGPRRASVISDETSHSESPSPSTMSSPKTSDYGSQASPMRVPANPSEIIKVAILGASGGIGQPLAMLLMLHSEYVQHLALYDLNVNIRGVGMDVSHIDRQCKVTTHLGLDELPDAVRDAKVIVVPAGLAQKPGVSRDDLFGTNAKIMYNLAKVCAVVAPNAMLAIVSNPVNSLVPLTCEVYNRMQQQQQQQQKVQQQLQQHQHQKQQSEGKHLFYDCYRRIFGVTTLDVVRASTLTAKSGLFKSEPNGLFKDPAKVNMPVVGGHAGKTIIPLLSQASPKLDKKRLIEDKVNTQTLIESIQQAGIDVLNAKKGTGSATLAMAYAACRFTIALLRAQQGEQNVIECAYVKHQHQLVSDLDYFATPLLLGKDGYTKSFGLGKLLPFEQQMIDEGANELRTSVAKGEDFAKEHLSSEKS